jgi:hypothetical protein
VKASQAGKTLSGKKSVKQKANRQSVKAATKLSITQECRSLLSHLLLAEIKRGKPLPKETIEQLSDWCKEKGYRFSM